MAKDRARDLRRVAKLNLSEPISHVKVVPAESKEEWGERKFGAEMKDYFDAQAAKNG